MRELSTSKVPGEGRNPSISLTKDMNESAVPLCRGHAEMKNPSHQTLKKTLTREEEWPARDKLPTQLREISVPTSNQAFGRLRSSPVKLA